MAADNSIEILDLRHFPAPVLRPVLEAESEVWRQRLHWDYRGSSKLLMQYIDSHMLPGYAALESGKVTGYTFCVYEESKAVIGDVFAMQGAGPETVNGALPAYDVEETLLRHLLETLLNSPQVDRIESQLLLHPAGAHGELFLEAGFRLYPRLFMVQQLSGHWSRPLEPLPGRRGDPAHLELRAWRDEDLPAASHLISEAYHGHPDSLINDQYHSPQGSLRFLHNIVRYSGCGVFSALASHVVVDRASRELVALVLGSRVSPESGHVTQLCVHPAYRRQGMARLLLAAAAAQFVRQGVAEVSLTVTEANRDAIDLYEAEGYQCRHRFDAAVWQRYEKA
ncbi:MAG TPA: GNAT family N-acetyltransferase [Terracidiphilus sp.]|jgi:ribosomal protein S18 acetylase RimI-like enzyme|nr:GNAT family N-acetyltransferase [Terracidiphilus sp.]